MFPEPEVFETIKVEYMGNRDSKHTATIELIRQIFAHGRTSYLAYFRIDGAILLPTDERRLLETTLDTKNLADQSESESIFRGQVLYKLKKEGYFRVRREEEPTIDYF